MVVGFEKETRSLNEAELKLVQEFIKGFKLRIGRDRKISAAEIELTYRNRGIKVKGHLIRGIVHHIRYNEVILINNKRYFLISDNTGYWLSCDQDEIRKFAESLEQRAGSILSIKNAVDMFLNAHASKQYLKDQGDLFNGRD